MSCKDSITPAPGIYYYSHTTLNSLTVSVLYLTVYQGVVDGRRNSDHGTREGEAWWQCADGVDQVHSNNRELYM